MIQPLQWIMGQNVLFLILISHILLMMAVSEPRLRFDGACPRAQNAKIRTCWSLQNNNLASDSWTRDWGCSWVGTERAPGSASSPLRLRGEGTVIIKLFAVSDVRTAPQTIISWLCGLVNGAFEGPSSRLCCFASLSVISQRLFFCFFFFGQRELFSMKTPIKVCRQLNTRWHTDIVGNSPVDTLGLLSNQEMWRWSATLVLDEFGFISQKWPCFINSPQREEVQKRKSSFSISKRHEFKNRPRER